MNRKILLATLTILSLNSPNAYPCPLTANNPLAYVRRDNNRCEGLLPRNISSSLNLTSFTTHTLSSTYPNILVLRIPGTSNNRPQVKVQSLVKNYLLDELTRFIPRPTGFQFNLPTDLVLDKADVPPNSLRATAYITSNSQPIYYPVIIGQPSGKYEFVIYAPQRTTFPTLEIRRNGQTIFSKPYNSPRRGEVRWSWDYRNAQAGRYELYIVAQQQQYGAPPERIERRILFEHNPTWLK